MFTYQHIVEERNEVKVQLSDGAIEFLRKLYRFLEDNGASFEKYHNFDRHGRQLSDEYLFLWKGERIPAETAEDRIWDFRRQA